MSKLRLAILAATATVVFAAAPALAMTWGGEVFGAFGTHSMSDWKDLTQAVNAVGGSMDDPTSSFGGGLGLRLWPNTNFMIAATYEPIFLTRKEGITGEDLKLDANSFQVTGSYYFPTTGPGKFGVGAGLGYYSLSGKFFGPLLSGADLSGSTVGFHFMGMGEWTVSPGFALTGTAGYRVAKISDTKFNDQSAATYFGDPTFRDVETDYSGLMLRAGVAFYMPSSNR